jgi:hypothetical protein
LATLNVLHTILSYGDDQSAGSPLRRYIDWARRLLGIEVENPLDNEYTIPAGGSLTVFNGTRATSIDGTTQFTLSKNPILPSTYRFTFAAGTDPVLRAARALNLTGIVTTMTPNGDGTLTMSVGAGTPFSAVQAGDNLFIPGVSTGDGAGHFSPANQGLWTVLVATGASLQLGRTGAFSGFLESPTPTGSTEVLAFAAAGIQIGDTADISAGFASVTLGSYVVSQVTSKWFEVTSAKGLPAQAGVIPGATGLQFYTDCKRWLRVEVDQEAVLRFNGDTSNANRVAPVAPGDTEKVGWLDKFGPVYSLVIVNRAAVAMQALVQSAE